MAEKVSPLALALRMAWANPEWKAKQVIAVKAGIERRKAAGLHIGRPLGSKTKPKKAAVEQVGVVDGQVVEQKDPA